MRFKVSMIDYFEKIYDETIIADNENEAKITVHSLNPKSIILGTKWLYEKFWRFKNG